MTESYPCEMDIIKEIGELANSTIWEFKQTNLQLEESPEHVVPLISKEHPWQVPVKTNIVRTFSVKNKTVYKYNFKLNPKAKEKYHIIFTMHSYVHSSKKREHQGK